MMSWSVRRAGHSSNGALSSTAPLFAPVASGQGQGLRILAIQRHLSENLRIKKPQTMRCFFIYSQCSNPFSFVFLATCTASDRPNWFIFGAPACFESSTKPGRAQFPCGVRAYFLRSGARNACLQGPKSQNFILRLNFGIGAMESV